MSSAVQTTIETPIAKPGFSGEIFKDFAEDPQLKNKLLAGFSIAVDGILDHMLDGFFAIARDWTVLFCNAPAEVIAGQPRSKIIGKNLWDIVPQYVNTPIYEKYCESMESQKPITFVTFLEVVNAWIETRLFPSEKGLAVYFRDVTQQKRMEDDLKNTVRDLQQTSERLSRVNKELEDFAAIASHDLREPLKSICLIVDVIRRRPLQQADDFLLQIRRQGESCLHLIQHLLDYSRAVSDNHAHQEIDLNEVLKDVQANLLQSIQSTGAQIKFENLPRVLGNSFQLLQVFQNLIGNSIKYRRPDLSPEIRLSALVNRSEVVITLSDNGRGIPFEHLPFIFDLYKTYANSEGPKGHGVGLATVKRIILNHGGRIDVTSEVGKGTQFIFSLPKAKS